jgi:hypothetical protein
MHAAGQPEGKERAVTMKRLAWVAWIVGVALVALQQARVVSTAVGWIGLALAVWAVSRGAIAATRRTDVREKEPAAAK